VTDLERFEREMRKSLEAFEGERNPTKLKPPRRRVVVSKQTRGVEVTLCVRDRKHSFLDERFVTLVEGTISTLEARIEAEKRAKNQGWRHVAYLIDTRVV